jgi:hypothetical protein
MTSRRFLSEGFGFFPVLRLLLLSGTAGAVFIAAATATAHAACVEDGIAKYRKGARNAASYVGHSGEVCKTVIAGGSDPITGITGVNPNIVGKLEVSENGWQYTFSSRKDNYVETLQLAVIHKSGASTYFDIKASRIDR